MNDELTQQLSLLPNYLSNHLLLSVTAIVCGIALTVPLTVIALRRRRMQGPLLAIASTIQTIPGLALLALMVPILRQIGFLPAAIALILYSVLPMLRNAVTGIEDVDPNLIEAGRGLGMTENQLLMRVQLPLAMPVIVAGIRTATVWVVGMATLSTPVGATSLGNYIFSGLQTQNYTAVLVGCVAAALLALVLDRLIHTMETALAKRNARQIAATGIATLVILAAGLSPLARLGSSADGASEIVIGTKTFTEQYILGEFIASELETAGFGTRRLESLGSTVGFDALAAGRIDAWVDYSGTIWATYMQRETNPGRAAVFAGVRQWLAEEHDIEIAARLGFENAYAVAVTNETAERYGLRTVDDLVALAPNLTFASDYEFFSRTEWTELAQQYGLEFAELVSMDSSLMYSAVDTGEVDVITAFSTDGRIGAYGLRLLEDTRGALPPYDALLLTSPGLREQQPGAFAALAALEQGISQTAMQAANQTVDIDNGTVPEAAELLRSRLGSN